MDPAPTEGTDRVEAGPARPRLRLNWRRDPTCWRAELCGLHATVIQRSMMRFSFQVSGDHEWHPPEKSTLLEAQHAAEQVIADRLGVTSL